MEKKTRPIIHPHEVQLFLQENREKAGEVWNMPRNGKPLALFIYTNGPDIGHGHLYVAFPLGWGLTHDGHRALIETGSISEFKQGVEIITWIADVEIEQMLTTIFNNLGLLSGNWPAPDNSILI